MRAGRLLWPAVGLLLLAVFFWQADLVGRATAPPGWSQIPTGANTAPSAPEPGRVIAEGRVVTYPGAQVVVGSEIGGTIVNLTVQEQSPIHKDLLIAELRSDDLRAAIAEALAHIGEAEADIRYFARELQRADRLQSRGAVNQSEIDFNQHNIEIARSRRAAALASREHLEALLAKTRILSPIDGVVITRHAHLGETLLPAAPVVTVADLNRLRIEAEIDEYDIGKVGLGSEVRVTAEGFPTAAWRGTVEEIPDVVVGRRIRPEDPNHPTDIRVLLVKIALAEPTPLKLGQRVEIEVEANSARGR